MKHFFITIAFTLIFFSTSSHSVLMRGWNSSNYPGLFDPNFESRVDLLPASSRSTTNIWSGYYWPHRFGGIAFRWRDARSFESPRYNSKPFNYKTYSENVIYQMSESQLDRLSPAEKFDIVKLRFDYPTVQRELDKTNSTDPKWFGICEGWTAASLIFQEPKSIRVRVNESLVVPFSSSDIKALLSYGESQFNPGVKAAIGRRCNSSNPEADECWDTNPGAFHLILANNLGRLKKSFAMDVSQGAEVWNQPVVSFTSQISTKRGISPRAAAGTAFELYATTKVWYAQEITPQRSRFGNPYLASKSFRYTLELNENREIIGGEWISGDRPDFLWLPKDPEFNRYDYYSFVGKLYEWSTN